jgi:hypothetical protein
MVIWGEPMINKCAIRKIVIPPEEIAPPNFYLAQNSI